MKTLEAWEAGRSETLQPRNPVARLLFAHKLLASNGCRSYPLCLNAKLNGASRNLRIECLTALYDSILHLYKTLKKVRHRVFWEGLAIVHKAADANLTMSARKSKVESMWDQVPVLRRINKGSDIRKPFVCE